MELFWLSEQKPMGLSIFAVGFIFFALEKGILSFNYVAHDYLQPKLTLML